MGELSVLSSFWKRFQSSLKRMKLDSHLKDMARQVRNNSKPFGDTAPVLFFNASSRIGGLSLNAAFSLLTAWGLRVNGIPAVHFVCRSGMTRCVLGTNRDEVSQPTPCAICIRHSEIEYEQAHARYFGYTDDKELRSSLSEKSVNDLMNVEYDNLPLGRIVLPAIRWELRRHHLIDDDSTRFLYREFLLSALNVSREFSKVLDDKKPQAVVVFNGQFFPEAVARFVALRRGIRVISHEVGMLPFTAFFTDGEATAYPIDIPESFKLSEIQNEKLDEYLSKRFQGNFKMAGIQFWHGMKPLDESLLRKMASFKQTVPIFTNVIFDTSQHHSNTLFEDMFTWLDELIPVFKGHPDTLFVIRAHPDELRPGSAKQSRETVREWVKTRNINEHLNVHYVDALEYLSSYELIQKSKFVMVYNSSIGLEASIMGIPVLAAGQARYTRYPTVFYPSSKTAYFTKLSELLFAAELIHSDEYRINARKFLYYQLFRTAIPFGDYLEETERPGLVTLKFKYLAELRMKNSKTMKILVEGITQNKPFENQES